MESLQRKPEYGSRSSGWAVEIVRWLEEQHVSAWSHAATDRREFAQGLAAALAALPDTEVCWIDGRHAHDLATFNALVAEAAGVRMDGEMGEAGGCGQRSTVPAGWCRCCGSGGTIRRCLPSSVGTTCGTKRT